MIIVTHFNVLVFKIKNKTCVQTNKCTHLYSMQHKTLYMTGVGYGMWMMHCNFTMWMKYGNPRSKTTEWGDKRFYWWWQGRWRAPSAGEPWEEDMMRARWDRIRTAHWCSVNPRLACSWHLYLLRSHTQGCRKLTLRSCCCTAAGMSAFWWSSLGSWVKSKE